MSKQRVMINEITSLENKQSVKSSDRSTPTSSHERHERLAAKQPFYRIVESYMRLGLDRRSAVIAYGAEKLARQLQEAKVDPTTGDKLIKEILRSGRGPESPEFTNLFGSMIESLGR